ncbi:type II toxin-antitoxin system PemK/MazF family toxin [Actinoplanes sp. NPDC026619]|uniref:type II toxin-antitoxin system PemK/MazF family toxin n=1 Tax=Actinoplanes sp. NPDC026619 TaxID=3155798 RepID=UPI0033CD34A5
MSKILKSLLRMLTPAKPAPTRSTPKPAPTRSTPKPAPTRSTPKPGPRGRHLEYAPNPDGDADPGEIVWTWVPYEDDPAQGKDRPVLVVGREGSDVLGLMLSSQSERDGQRNWFALGPGHWDREERPSWIRLDRVLHIDHDGIRREGAVLDRARFDQVATKLRKEYGWA